MSRPLQKVVVSALILGGLLSCETRPPINRGQAAGIADNVQRQHAVDWGDPTEVLAPAPGADGRSWWQLRYRGDHLIIVDADSGWGRLPPPGYQQRITVSSSPAPVAAPTASAAPLVVEGSHILRLTVPETLNPEAVGTLEREAAELNVRAAQTGLHPLFSVRTDRQQQSALIYGWQGDRGIARDDHAFDWIRLRTPHQNPVWIDLLPGENAAVGK